MAKIDPILARYMRRASFACAVAVVLIALTVIVGHLAGIRVFTSVVPGLATMKFNTSLALLLTATAMICRQRSVWATLRYLADGCALLAFALATLTLLEYAARVDLHIDQLFRMDPTTPLNGLKGRMSSATAFALTMVSLAALLLDLRPRTAQIIALIAVPPVLLGMLGYAYGVGGLYEVSPFSSMAIHTALAIFLLAISVLSSRPRQCLHDLLLRRSPGGTLARRVLPVTVLVPLLLAIICLQGVRHGWFELSFGLAVVSVGSIVSVAAILWWNATLLDRADTVRHAAEMQRDVILVREQHARMAVEQALSARDQLLAVVSHELRQPLTPVLLTTAALLKGPPLPDDLREDIEMIHTQIAAEARAVNDLLEIAALNQGQVQLYPQPIQLDSLLNDMASLHRKDAVRQNLTLTVEPTECAVKLVADRRRVEQILNNLLSNAIKFTPPGGAVGLRCSFETGHAQIDVIDTGIGIDPATLPRLFAYFAQADASTRRRFGGMGIGLSIARRLAELHGGTLNAASDGAGCGSRFTLTLPHADPRSR